ncbi:M23 family metallopeptidase [Candidatus Woesearchaeota archaeon]|nr:M23 family metallopeptidase [Candidatus Woesearchaeota archaeon]
MRMIKGKKGVQTNIIVSIVTITGILTLIYLLIVLTSKMNDVSKGKAIGERQFELYAAYANGERALYYVDEASKIAVDKTAREIAKNGGYGYYYDEGYWLNSPCGTYNGFTLWKNGASNCYPDKGSATNNYFATLTKTLREYYERYPETSIPPDYSYTIKGSYLIGLANKAIIITAGKPNAGSAYTATDIISDFMWPAEAEISSCYGPREAPVAGVSNWHDGIDFAVPVGTDVKAIADGEVIDALGDPSYGNSILVMHGNIVARYAHLSKMLVKKGDKAEKGKTIGKSGNTGKSTGAHLHLAIYRQPEQGQGQQTFASASAAQAAAQVSQAAQQQQAQQLVLTNREDYNADPFCYLPKTFGAKTSYCDSKCSVKQVKTAGATGAAGSAASPEEKDYYTYKVKPSFRQKFDYDFEAYDVLAEKAKEIAEKCKDALLFENCISSFNGQTAAGLKLDAGCGEAPDTAQMAVKICAKNSEQPELEYRFALKLKEEPQP